MTIAARTGEAAKPKARWGTSLSRRRARTAYLFLAPVLAFFALLFFYPLGLELYKSLYTGPHTDRYAGGGNYARAVSDPVTLDSFQVTVIFAAGVVVVSIVLGLLFAETLNRRLPGRTIFRGILLIPYLTSVVIIGLLWRNILDPEVGILNRLLMAVDLPQQGWLNTHPLGVLVGVTVWQMTGYTTVLFLAGLQGIPHVYYEAAKIDGASTWTRFFRITLPLLAPTTLFVSVIGVISSLQAFAQPYIITHGGPGGATNLYVFRVYQVAFSFRDIGYSAAMSFLLMCVIFIVTVVQFRVGRREVRY
ncbi:MAG: carbohydrate ABC transporter permease [Nocardioidaceae bacterium]